MGKHRVASGVGKSLKYQEEFIAEVFMFFVVVLFV